MTELEEQISRLTCTFNDGKLEEQFKKSKLEKNSTYIRNLILLGHLIFLPIILDDVNQLGIQPLYVIVHILCSISVYALLFIEELRNKY